MSRDRYPAPEITLATLSGTGAYGAGPVSPPEPRNPISDAFDMPGQSAGAGVAYDPFLARMYERSEPIEKKFALTFLFPAATVTSLVIERSLKTNDFPWLCTQYRWQWSGSPLTPQFTPIDVQYGSSNDVTIGRDVQSDDRQLALISAVWGSELEWTFPSRPRLWRPNRFIQVKAQLDYAMLAGIVALPEPSALPASRLDVLFEGLELRPKT